MICRAYFFVLGVLQLCMVAAQEPYVSGKLSKEIRQPAQCWMAPASMLQADQAMIGIIALQPYGIADARQMYFFSCLPFDHQAAGFGLSRFWVKGYESLDLSLTYGRKLSGVWSLGAGITHRSEKFFDGLRYGSWKAVLNTRLQRPKWILGVYTSVNKPTNNTPFLLYADATAGIDMGSSIYLDFSLRWETEHGIGSAASFQYCFQNSWLLASRINTNPFSVAYETGYIKNGWIILVAGVQTPGIGWTPGVKLARAFGKRKLS